MHESDLCLGLTDETLEHLGKIGPKAQKTSRRDLSVVLSQVTWQPKDSSHLLLIRTLDRIKQAQPLWPVQ